MNPDHHAGPHQYAAGPSLTYPSVSYHHPAGLPQTYAHHHPSDPDGPEGGPRYYEQKSNPNPNSNPNPYLNPYASGPSYPPHVGRDSGYPAVPFLPQQQASFQHQSPSFSQNPAQADFSPIPYVGSSRTPDTSSNSNVRRQAAHLAYSSIPDQTIRIDQNLNTPGQGHIWHHGPNPHHPQRSPYLVDGEATQTRREIEGWLDPDPGGQYHNPGSKPEGGGMSIHAGAPSNTTRASAHPTYWQSDPTPHFPTTGWSSHVPPDNPSQSADISPEAHARMLAVDGSQQGSLMDGEAEVDDEDGNTGTATSRKEKRRTQNRVAQRAFRARSKIQNQEAADHVEQLEYLVRTQAEELTEMALVIQRLSAENQLLRASRYGPNAPGFDSVGGGSSDQMPGGSEVRTRASMADDGGIAGGGVSYRGQSQADGDGREPSWSHVDGGGPGGWAQVDGGSSHR